MDRLSNPVQAAALARFFKTDPGQYGEGDVFLGIKVPVQRQLAGKYKDMPLNGLGTLLSSPIHEHRLTALLILDAQYKKSENLDMKRQIVRFYLSHMGHVNNWDLVDLSAPNILGEHIIGNPPESSILCHLAKGSLWERRVAIVSTFAMIRKGQFKNTLKIAEILLKDEEDLIHKAVGWMLRETGKRDEKILTAFLDMHSKRMPRTMLRYAIERLPEKLKKHYMAR